MTTSLDAARESLRARLPDTIAKLRAAVDQHAPGSLCAREGYTIRNAAGDDGDTAVVRIYDEIWFLGVNAADFVEELDAITAPKMRVEINSPGGDVFDGVAIYNALRNHKAHVTTRVDGIAASIASVIFQAGDHRVMQTASQMMVHQAWGFTVGDADDHSDMAQILEQQDEVIAKIYADRSGGDIAHFRQLMADETWMTDQDAVDEGLADEVIDPPRKEAPADKAKALHQQISETTAVVAATVSSAERVVALRADAGKTLSNRNLESLAGLRDSIGRLDALLTEEEAQSDVDVSAEYLRFVAHTQGVTV